MQLALTKNERSRIADLNVTEADAALARARTAFLPVLSANGNDQIRGSGDPTNVATGSLSINQPIFNPSAFPLYAAGARAARQHQGPERRRQAPARVRRGARVLRRAPRRRRSSQAAQRQLDTAQANLADTQARAQAQLVSSNDVTRAQIDLGGALRERRDRQGHARRRVRRSSRSRSTRPSRATRSRRPTDAPRRRAATAAAARGAGPARARPPARISSRSASSAIAAHDFADEPLLRLVPTLGLQGAALSTTTDAPRARRLQRRVVTVDAHLDALRRRRALRRQALARRAGRRSPTSPTSALVAQRRRAGARGRRRCSRPRRRRSRAAEHAR